MTAELSHPSDARVSGAGVPDRGDPLFPTAALGGMAYVNTHIYCTAAHALADNGRARARTLFLVRRRKMRCKKVTIPTSWSESAAAHLCTPGVDTPLRGNNVESLNSAHVRHEHMRKRERVL